MKFLLYSFLLLSLKIFGSISTWDGDTDSDWGNSANWDVAPTNDTSTDTAFFPSSIGTDVITIGSDYSIGQLTITDAGDDNDLTFSNSSGDNTIIIGDYAPTTIPEGIGTSLSHLYIKDYGDNITFNTKVHFVGNGTTSDRHLISTSDSTNATLTFNNEVYVDSSIMLETVSTDRFLNIGNTGTVVNFNDKIRISQSGVPILIYNNGTINFNTASTDIVGSHLRLRGKGTYNFNVSNALSTIDLRPEHDAGGGSTRIYNTSAGLIQTNRIFAGWSLDTSKSNTIGGSHLTGTSEWSGDIDIGSFNKDTFFSVDFNFSAAGSSTVLFSGGGTPYNKDIYTNAFNSTLNKIGTGTVVFSGAKDFDLGNGGETVFNVTDGTLNLKHSDAIGSSNIILNIEGGILETDDSADEVLQLSTYKGILNENGTYIWDIIDMDGTTAGVHWDVLSFSNLLDIQASSSSKFNLELNRVNLGSDNWDNTSEYSFKIMEFGSINNFNAAYFNLDTVDFGSSPDGYSWRIIEEGGALYLKYGYTPEPSTWIMVSLIGVIICRLKKHRY